MEKNVFPTEVYLYKMKEEEKMLKVSPLIQQNSTVQRSQSKGNGASKPCTLTLNIHLILGDLQPIVAAWLSGFLLGVGLEGLLSSF